LKLAKQVGAAFMLLCCAAACWPQTKPCVDLTLKPTEPASHKVRSGITETANRMIGVRPSGTVDSTETICPLTNSEKFHVFLHDSYSPFNAVAAAFNAGISQASQGRRGYGQGWDAYGSRFGAAFADGESSDFFQSFLFPSLFHQDSRYFRMREGPVMRRSFYALTRVFVTHNDSGRHQLDAVALEDSQVCVIPYDELAVLSREIASLQSQFNRLMSREIVNDHGVMLLLGSMHAEERVAAFLLNLTYRLKARGFSASSVQLRMSREEIGSFLGLKLETVSRTFSKFQASGLLFVRQRQIQITDPVGLQQLLDGATA